MDNIHSEVMMLIETLERNIEKRKNMPIVKKIMIDRDEVLSLIKNIRQKLPENISRARYITEQQKQILVEAESQARKMVEDAERERINILDDHYIIQTAKDEAEKIKEEIINSAYEQSNAMTAQAQNAAKLIYTNSLKEAAKIFGDLEQVIDLRIERVNTMKDGLISCANNIVNEILGIMEELNAYKSDIVEKKTSLEELM